MGAVGGKQSGTIRPDPEQLPYLANLARRQLLMCISRGPAAILHDSFKYAHKTQ